SRLHRHRHDVSLYLREPAIRRLFPVSDPFRRLVRRRRMARRAAVDRVPRPPRHERCHGRFSRRRCRLPRPAALAWAALARAAAAGRLDLRQRLHSRSPSGYRCAPRSICRDAARACTRTRGRRNRACRPQPRRGAGVGCCRPAPCARRRFRPSGRDDLRAPHRRNHPEIRAASARAGRARHDRPRRGRALDRLDRISIPRRYHQLLQIRSGIAAAHSRRSARRQAGDPPRANPRYAAARDVCSLPPQRLAAALSLGHGQRQARALRLFSHGVRPGSLSRLDDVAGGTVGFRRGRRHLWRCLAPAHRAGAAVAMTLFAAKVIWVLGVVGWFIIRYPHDRRARHTPKLRRSDRGRELVLMAISGTGLGVLPFIYVVSHAPRFANYPFRPWQAWIGAVLFAVSLWLFYRTHKDLGRNWSVTLEVRDQHTLVTSGVYSRVRHPMYSAFWLWALAQALLLPNWIAGPAGLDGFGTVFFLRVGREGALMIGGFVGDYRRYMERTSRVLPGIY